MVVSQKNDPIITRMGLKMVVSGKNVPYIGDQWEECPLHWWSVGRMFLTLVVSGKNVAYIGGQWEEAPYTEQRCQDVGVLFSIYLQCFQ